MSVDTRSVIDQVFERVRSEKAVKGKMPWYLDTSLVLAFNREETEIVKRTSAAKLACEKALTELQLLEDVELPIARVEERRGESKQAAAVVRTFFHSGSEESAKAEGDEKVLDELYDNLIESLRDEKEKLELVHGGREGRGYIRSFIGKMVDATDKAVDGLGPYGRLKVYLGVVFALTGKDIACYYPGSELVRTLAIKGILLHEAELEVKLKVLETTGLKPASYLSVQDMLLFSATRDANGSKK